MIGLEICTMMLVVVGVLSDSPSGRSGATSYSTYNRKYEPNSGRSTYHGGKSAPKHSTSPRQSSYAKDSPSTYSQDSGPSRDSQSYSSSPSTYSDDPNYSRSSPNYEGSSSPSTYNNDAPSFSSSPAIANGPNYSGENFKSGTSHVDAPSIAPNYSNFAPSHDIPHYPVNNAPPIHHGPINIPQHDIPFNNGIPSYIPSGPTHIPHFDSSQVIPQHPVNFGFNSYSPHLSLLGGGQHQFPLHIPKQPFQFGLSSIGHPGQFSFGGDQKSHQFGAPFKVYQPVAIQPQLLLASSSKVPLVYRPSYQHHPNGSPANFGRLHR